MLALSLLLMLALVVAVIAVSSAVVGVGLLALWAFLLLSILLCARHMVRSSEFVGTVTMLAAAAVGYVTYIGNGLDRDFDLHKVWIWHGCIGVFAIHEINCMAAFGA